jgi:shikimate dehydrogenase
LVADNATGSAQLAAQHLAPSFLVGLIGDGIAASRTPRMHEAEGDRQGLNFEYRLIDTATMPGVPLAALLDRIEREGYTGVNVTYPHKRAAIAHIDELSRNAELLGSVNTIVFRDGRRFGHNTDYWGFAESLRRELPGAKCDAVLLIGAGGAGAAVAHALVDAGTDCLFVHDLDGASAEAIVDALVMRHGVGRAAVAPFPDVLSRVDGIVNATPVGMAKLPGSPLPTARLEPRHWVADIVYFPMETQLLAAARATGCRVLPGAGMAIYQAVRAFELFTGRPADAEAMCRTFEAFENFDVDRSARVNRADGRDRPVEADLRQPKT